MPVTRSNTYESQRDALANLLRSIVTDVEAMKTQSPFDYRQIGEDSGHWFGPFGESGLDDAGELTIIEWPNLSVLAAQAKAQLEMLGK